MEQQATKIVNNCFNTNIYSYLESSDGQSLNQYLNAVHFFNTSLIRQLGSLRPLFFCIGDYYVLFVLLE
jgi:hypothetical protein